MKRYILAIILLAITLPCFWLFGIPAGNSSGRFESVVFRNIKQNTLKKDCYRIMGKHDAFPHYSCLNSNRIPVRFDPKDEWEVIHPVCFRHTLRDTVKTGFYKIPARGNRAAQYTFFNHKTDTLENVQPGKNWESLDGKNPVCMSETNEHPDVPRNFKITLKQAEQMEQGKKSGASENKGIRIFPGCGSLRETP